MYTIKQAALQSGVGVALIRAWERRYGVVEPARTPSGYRLYGDGDIARLRAMRLLVDAGWSAGQAAVEIRTTDAPLVTGAATAVAAAEPAGEPAGPTERPPLGPAGTAFVEAARRCDVAGIEAALDEMLSRGSFEAVVDDLLLPAVAALGTAWAGGEIDVAAEHLASAAVMRRLGALFALSGAAGVGRRVLVGLAAEGKHEIGAQAFAVALRRLGVDVIYLGADVPTASWVTAAHQSDADAVVIGVVAAGDVREAAAAVAALRAARPQLVVALGGARAGEAAAIEFATTLPERVVAAARLIAREVAGRP